MGLLIRLQVVMLGIYLSITIETRKKDRIEIGLFFWEVQDKKCSQRRNDNKKNKDVVQIHHLLMESRKKIARLPSNTFDNCWKENIASWKGATEPIPWLVLDCAWHKYSRMKIFVWKHGALLKVPFRLLTCHLFPRYASGRGERN